MITIKTKFSEGNFILSEPIPADAVSIIYGEKETIVYTKEDVIPERKFSDDTLRNIELLQAFEEKKSKRDSDAYTDFVITDPVAVKISEKYPIKINMLQKLKSFVGLG